MGQTNHKELRALLVEAAQSILRSGQPLARWGHKLLARKGAKSLVVAAIARKLTVAIWYLMMGHWVAVEEIDQRLASKVTTILSAVGQQNPQRLGKTRQEYRQEIYDGLKTRRVYQLDPHKTYKSPQARPVA